MINLNHELINYIEKEEDSYISLLQDLVELESPTHNKEYVDKLVDYIENYLKNYNIKLDRKKNTDFGDHLIGEWGEGEEQILIIGHIDTVWELNTIDTMPFSIEDGIIRGPGVYDMKGGIMQVLYAIKIMNQLNLKPNSKIKFIFNTDEEVGSPSSWNLIEKKSKESKYALIVEPADLPNGAVKTSRLGFGIFQMIIKGKPSHAGADPKAGVSAVNELAKQIIHLNKLAETVDRTSINVGKVKGGTRANVVPASVEALIDIRFDTMKAAKTLITKLREVKPFDPKIKLTINGDLNRPPFERKKEGIELYELVKTKAEKMGIHLPETSSGGVSDGNITASMGVPTLCGLGVVGFGAHSDDEHCLKSFIPERIALLVKLFTEL